MRYIGRIITSSKIDGLPEFIEVTKDRSSIVEGETKVPTLIVGYKNAVDILNRELKITDKIISKNLYWTFSKRERRTDYELDVEMFISSVAKFLTNFCQYVYVDPIVDKGDGLKEFSEVVSSTLKKVVYITGAMYYVYCPAKNKTYGLSKAIMEFMGFTEETVLGRILKDNAAVVPDTFQVDNKIMNTRFVVPLLWYLETF